MSQNYALPTNQWGFPSGNRSFVVVEADGSLRLDPCHDREAWCSNQVPCTPGQIITASAMIRTGTLPTGYTPPEPWSNGARIGIDFRDGAGTIMPVNPLDEYVPPFPNGNPWNNGLNAWWVDWGKGWTQRNIKATVPNFGVNVILWVQAMNDLAPASAWFNSATLYITSSTPPPPVPPNKSFAARIPMMPILVHQLLRRARNKVISEEVHKKLHPLV